MKRWTLVLALPLAALGCLEEETRHTLYLEPDGALAWAAEEAQVRSDLDDADERRLEEREFLEAARSGLHPVAEALRSLGAESLTTTLLRERRPFHVVTEAELGPVDRFAREVLWRLGIPGEARLVASGELRTLEVTLRPDEADDDALDEDDPVLALLADLDDYRIVLTGGRFVAARGFEIVRDGTVALPLEAEAERPQGAALVLALSWRVE